MKESYDYKGGWESTRNTVGLELFASSIGFDGDFILGLGATFGWYVQSRP